MKIAANLRLAISLLCLGYVAKGFGQSPAIDSLTAQLDQAENIARIEILEQLSFKYWDYNISKAYNYSLEGLQLSEALEYKKGICWSRTNIGLYHSFNGNYDLAMDYYRSALASLDGNIQGKFPSYTFSRMANVFRIEGTFDSALFYYRKAFGSVPKNDYRHHAPTILHNLGITYLEQEKYDSAEISLKKSFTLRKSNGDSSMIAMSIQELGRLFLERQNYDSAQYYLEWANSISSRNQLPEQRIFYLVYDGEMEFAKGNFYNAIASVKEAIELLNNYPYKELSIKCLFLLGKIYAEVGEYDGGIDNLLNAQSLTGGLYKKLDGQINYQLGFIYYYQNNLSLASEVAYEAKQTFKKLKLKGKEADVNNLLGLIKLEEKQFGNSEQYFDSAALTYRESGYKKGIAAVLYNKSFIYEKQGNLEKVLAQQKEALAIEKEIGNIPGIIISYNSLGKLLMDMSKIEEAEQYLLEANALLQQKPSPSYEEQNNLYLSELYAAKGQYQRAYQYLQLSKANSDSILSETSLTRSLELTALHDLEKKELEIENLNQEQEAKTLELQIKESQLQLQRYFLYFGGIAIAFFAILSYILVKTIKKLHKTQTELIKAEKRASLSILVAGLGHEINNPLNFIKGGSEGLRFSQDTWTDDQEQFLNSIDEGVSRTSNIVKLLNQFERKDTAFLRRYNLNSILKSCINELSDDIPKSKSVSLVKEDELAIVLGYENDLKQLFKELITNGLESIKSTGDVSISISTSTSHCIVQISDNGLGIDEKHIAMLENPFFTTKEANESKGFGLYIVDYILNDHHGKINFKSTKGSGTTVSVSLPRNSA